MKNWRLPFITVPMPFTWGGKDFSLRHHSGNFDTPDLQRAVSFAHRHGVKVYVACNIFPRNSQLDPITGFLHDLSRLCPDALIVADPGILSLARKVAPGVPLHLSTQANTTNLAAARFWQEWGVRRLNVARELSMADIRVLAEKTHLEIEAFVHGAMCIAYSGRCLLSAFMPVGTATRADAAIRVDGSMPWWKKPGRANTSPSKKMAPERISSTQRICACWNICRR